jgi:hypothetical protein
MEVENPNLYDIFEEGTRTKDKLDKRSVVQAVLLFNEEIIMGIILHFVGGSVVVIVPNPSMCMHIWTK